MGSTKENPTTGALPDENFARELMQLFTIGLYQLNLDGSVKFNHDTGQPLATYSQNDIQELARALTGWNKSDVDFVLPMRVVNSLHDTNKKVVLGSTIPAGLNAEEELELVIDILMLMTTSPLLFLNCSFSDLSPQTQRQSILLALLVRSITMARA